MTLIDNIVTLFGIGRARTAPGTLASLAALPPAWLIAWGGGGWNGRGFLLLAGLAAFAIGTWASDVYAREKGRKDPSECVIDELAGQWIACAFAPLNIWAYLLAFILFRAFDIAKPWPISRAERLPGGLGIMADDVVAGLAAAAVIAVLAHAGIF